VGRLGRRILRLDPFKFRVKHTRGVDNVVADALSRMFGGNCETPKTMCVSLMQSLALVYSLLEEHQKQDPFCMDICDKLRTGNGGVDNFQRHKRLLCYCPKGTRSRRWLVPISLRAILLQYFHDSVLSAHLGVLNTFQEIARTYFWPRTRAEIFDYVRLCVLCQRVKPAQNSRLGLHSALPVSEPMERLFIDLMGPLTRSKLAIFVVVDAFSKFVSFFTVRKISSQVVCNCLERTFSCLWYACVYCDRQCQGLPL
jgi:hypothetical protein